MQKMAVFFSGCIDRFDGYSGRSGLCPAEAGDHGALRDYVWNVRRICAGNYS